MAEITNELPKTGRVSLRGYLQDVKPRVLWQSLFNLYRELGCPLDRMDNILLDLENCQRAVNMASDKPLAFIWSCEPGDYRTLWRYEWEWSIADPTQYAMTLVEAWVVLCKLTGHEATFNIIKSEQSSSRGLTL